MARRGLGLAALAAVLLMLVPSAFGTPGGLPGGVSSYLLGPKLIRAEIAVKGKNQTALDFLVDRGKLLKRYSAKSLILLERDGTASTIPVTPFARVTLNGRPSSLHALRAGMQIVVAHQGAVAADTVYAGSPKLTVPKLPPAVNATLLGNKLIRAEVFLKDTALHDYRLDRGRIKQLGASTLVLHEPDGTDQSIDVSSGAHVKLNGRTVSFLQLQIGMMAITMRDHDNPADQVFATGVKRR